MLPNMRTERRYFTTMEDRHHMQLLELKARVRDDRYEVDPNAVAAAILRRLGVPAVSAVVLAPGHRKSK